MGTLGAGNSTARYFAERVLLGKNSGGESGGSLPRVPKGYYQELVKGWDTPERALAWAASKGISKEQLGSYKFLARTASKSKEEGGVGVPLSALHGTILNDSRFEEFPAFTAWLNNLPYERRDVAHYTGLLCSWDTPEKIIAWAASKGISKEQLGSYKFLSRTASKSKEEGGIGETLYSLLTAILKDPRFEEFAAFTAWLNNLPYERRDIGYYTDLFCSWDTPEKAIAWAASKGISKEQLCSSMFLIKTSGKSKEDGGISELLRSLYKAIHRNPRFGTLPAFTAWLNNLDYKQRERVDVDYVALVSGWDAPEKALKWAASKGITKEQLGRSKFLRRTAGKPKEEGGIGEVLYSLHSAILRDPRFGAFPAFTAWLNNVTYERRDRVDYTALLSSWDTPEKAIAWAVSKGISKEQLVSTTFLTKISGKSIEEGGIGEPLVSLYITVSTDPRFGAFPAFRSWINNVTYERRDLAYYTTLLTSWDTPEKAIAWAVSKEISKEQLSSYTFLTITSSKSIEEGGIRESLNSLYVAICNDPRFEGSSAFAAWLNNVTYVGRELAYYTALVSSWDTPEKALAWAVSRGIRKEELSSVKFLSRISGKSIEERGIWEPLGLLKKAIRNDPRFEGMTAFTAWINNISYEQRNLAYYTALVSSWESPEKALAWAVSKGISKEQLSSGTFLSKISGKSIDEGGIGECLGLLNTAIRNDPRFEGLPAFTAWLNNVTYVGRGLAYYTVLVSSWDTPQTALAWAVSKGIIKEQLCSNKFLIKTAGKSIEEGGIQESLNCLAIAIRNDPRFEGMHAFTAWINDIPYERRNLAYYTALVSSWETPEKALAWAVSKGISKEQLSRARFLSKISGKSIEAGGGIGEQLQYLYKAIRKDPRFGGCPAFAAWLNNLTYERLGAAYYIALVSSWSTPKAAFEWAAFKGISKEQLGSSTFLTITSCKSIEQGGIDESLCSLYRAILNDPRFENFQAFKSFLGLTTPPISDSLKEALSTPAGQALLLLAKDHGESALAEYLVATNPDRFEYTTELIENLRPYLGDLETTSHLSAEQLPVGILQLSELSHLRQALFNHYRDKYQPLFSESLQSVLAELTNLERAAQYPEQREFINTLISYFIAVENLLHPSRLKDSISGSKDFPAKHQKVAIYECAVERSLLVADEMGGGKTGSAIGTFEHLRDQGKAHRALVICPAKAISVWKKALSNGQAGYFKAGCEPKVLVIEKGYTDWSAAKEADYVVVSLERTRSKGRFQKLQELGSDFLIFDEAHNAKSAKIKKGSVSDTERVYQISQTESLKSGYLMLLSGTPIPNTLRDLAAQIRLLYSGREGDVVRKLEGESLDLTHIPTLANQILRSHPLVVRNLLVRKMLRRKTEDCLPVGTTLEVTDIPLKLGVFEQVKYNSLVESPFFNASQKLSKLRRAALHSEAKYCELQQAIERALSREKYSSRKLPAKILIAESSFAKGITRDWNDSRSRAEAQGSESYIASRLQNDFAGRVKVFVLDSKNSSKRTKVINEFGEYQGAAILLTLVQVVGEGLDITSATDGILLSPPYTVSANDQFIRRMFRAGQIVPVDVQRLITEGSIEEGISLYAERKERVVQGVIEGRPLTAYEKELLKDDFNTVRTGGVLSYETMTARQKALWILSRITGKGHQAIREFLAANNGRYGKDFAEGYAQDEETSSSGNTARVVKGIIDTLRPTKNTTLLDIACGCRTLDRMFEGDRKITVSSFDINEAALKVGGEMLQKKKEVAREEIGSMDSLSAETASKDIVVLSLALDMTQHSRLRGAAGRERLRTLSEINRVLKQNGSAVLTFQKKLFPDEESFEKFVTIVSEHFGFRITKALTGRVQSAEGGVPYSSWVVTLQKTEDAFGDDAPEWSDDALYLGLKFPRVKRESRGADRVKQKQSVAQQKSGSYHDSFTIREASIVFKATTMPQLQKEAERRSDIAVTKRVEDRIATLKDQYGSFQKIPAELLLSISLKVIAQETQEARDHYFKLLLAKYKKPERVPVDEISRESDVVLLRGYSKRLGYYLCLAKLDASTGKKHGFKTRYFFE